MRTEARFPDLAEGAGHYESFYIKATRPGGGRGLWIRYTVHRRPGSEPTASLWFTLFDAAAAGPRAVKATLPGSELRAPEGGYIAIGDSRLEPGRARGRAEAGGIAAGWELDFETSLGPLRHLPRDWMYRARLPRTKLLSPHPDARFTGTVTIDGERIDVDRWPGMVGHNWGAEHAERWIWVHAADLRGGEGYLDLAAGRVRVGATTTPWIANGVLRLDGEDLRLGGLGRIRGTTITERPTRCDLALTGRGVEVSGRVSAEPRNFVGWIYADPDGGEHSTVNCSIADLELTVERRGAATRRLESLGAAAYELGMREADHGIPIQPFPDG